MHEHELRVQVAGEQRAHVAGGDELHRHPVVAGVVAGVDLERQIVLDRQLDAARPAPVPQAEPGVEVDLVLGTAEHRVQGSGRVRVAALDPVQGARVRVLGLDRDRARRVPGEDRLHGAPERRQVGDLDAGLRVDGLGIDVAAAEAEPGQVVQEEVESGGVRRALPEAVVGLHLVEVGHVVQQAVALTRRAQIGGPALSGCQTAGGQLVQAVGVPGDQADRLAVAGELRCPPSSLDPPKPAGDVRIGAVEEALHGLLGGAGGPQVGPHVVAEQVLQDVGAVVHPSRLPLHVLVGVDQRRLLDVTRQIRCHRCLLPATGRSRRR